MSITQEATWEAFIILGIAIEERKQELLTILSQSPVLYEILSGLQELSLSNYCVGAGCIAQTVWNNKLGLDPLHGISDVDIVYFDGTDLSYEAEDAVIRRIENRFAHLPVTFDIKNQARVHLWYESKFGKAIAPYASLEHAIDAWPTTATSVGVRLLDGGLWVYAPYGLKDLFSMTVRANKRQVTQEAYEAKSEKWRARWPVLNIIPW